MFGLKRKKKTARQVALEKVTKLGKEPNGAAARSKKVLVFLGVAFALLYILVDLSPEVSLLKFVGTALIVFSLVSVLGFFLAKTEGAALTVGKVTVTGVLLFVVAVVARLAAAGRVPAFLIPLALVAILASIVYGESMGIAVALFGAFLSAVALNVGADIGSAAQNRGWLTAVVLATGASVGALLAREINTRRTPVVAGAVIAGIHLVMILGKNLLTGDARLNGVLVECAYGTLNGVATGFLLAGALPFIEKAFGVTTNIRLRELSDLNHPLLKALAMNAPGTYQHSLMVGSLAEAAAEAVGANALLARVGSYYHDVGKANKPSYFAENQAGAESKHESLSPAMSTLIIVSHAKDGLELANEYGLPPPVKDIIMEHHGTTLVEYFYSQAKDRKGSDDVPKEEAYRYPGPKPRSMESAIVLLADSVESSTRTLDDFSPSKLENHVHWIVDNKLRDGQLDHSMLTLADINKIEKSFVKTLANLYHARVKYPSQMEKKQEGTKSVESST